MPICINQDGTWRCPAIVCANQSGTWRNIDIGCINESATWRKILNCFITRAPLGSAVCGGYLICRAANVAWIVAPSSSEVQREWPSRNDANTTANQVSGCTGWFVPNITQLQNPGFSCRSNWDTYQTSMNCYWSSTERNGTHACYYSFAGSGFGSFSTKTGPANIFFVRSFRCVTY